MKGANKDPSAWYPGKHLRRFSTSSSDKAAAAAVHGGGDPSSPNAQRAAVSGAAVSTAVESSRNPVERHDPAGVSFDDACVIDGTVSGGERSATVTLSLLDLRFPRTQTPRVQVTKAKCLVRRPCDSLLLFVSHANCFSPGDRGGPSSTAATPPATPAGRRRL